MNKDNAAQFLPLVQALADGKTIQVTNRNKTTWIDLDEDIVWSENPDYYRIKPEPRTLIVWINKDGRVREDGTRSAPHCGEGWEKIRVREILD